MNKNIIQPFFIAIHSAFNLAFMKKLMLLSACLIVFTLFSQRLVDFVNPFIGTGGHGHTYPGATMPFGMVQLSPDNGTQGWDWCSGYNSDNKPYIIMFCESENYLEYIQKYYPEVKEEHISFCNEYETITFTNRFQKPKWYNSEISKL